VWTWAGRFYVDGLDPDEAVAAAVAAVRRQDAIIAHVIAAEPSADREIVARRSAQFWSHSTRSATKLVLESLAKEAAERKGQRSGLEAELGRLARIYYPALPRAEVVAAALAVLQRPAESDPRRAVNIAAHEVASRPKAEAAPSG
jgi:hypothetical protein